MKKPYATHELAYTRMREQGIDSWDQFAAHYGDPQRQIDVNFERFLVDTLAQTWAPRGGRALELGCGTGPLVRWLNDRGFAGRGVDVSPTAVAMATSLSAGRELTFEQADVCAPDLDAGGTYDLVLDGHCLHCVLTESDRAQFLHNAREALAPGGTLVISTMCRPVNRPLLRQHQPQQRLIGSLIYAPFAEAPSYQGAREIEGRMCMPTRFIGEWKSILRDIRAASFEVRVFRFSTCTEEEPVSELFVAARGI